jgi:hypothetical protein
MMKSFIIASLVASAAAFAPAQQGGKLYITVHSLIPIDTFKKVSITQVDE